MSKPLSDALALVNNTKQEVNKLLSAPEHVGNLLSINTHFDHIAYRLKYVGGVLEGQPVEEHEGRKKSAPITNFLGEELILPTGVRHSDLNPDEEKKKRYLDSVDKLWKELPGMNPYSVLKSYTIPEDITILRGVAKRAQVKDYETKELTTGFVEDIQLGIDIVNEQKVLTESVKPEPKKKGQPA